MAFFFMLTITSLALCLAPVTLFLTRARPAPAGADVFGWDLSRVRIVGIWYSGAMIAAGTLTTVFLYWPLAVLYLLLGVAALVWSMSYEVPLTMSAVLAPDEPPPAPSAEEFERCRRQRRQSVAVAVVALALASLFAFTAATIAREELPGGQGADRSPRAVAVALIESAPVNAALYGVVPQGGAQAGTQVAIVKTAQYESQTVDFRVITRATDGASWSSLETAPSYPTADAAVVAVVADYGIERFALWLTDTGEEPPGVGQPADGPADTTTD